jgi:transposase
MSLHPRRPDPIPDDTARVARAAFPAGNLYLRMRDALDVLVQDEDLGRLFPVHGQPAEAPWRLALVTLFQFAEGLSDRQAADAVRERIDWKYALSLELTDPGFDHTVLSEFRSRLVEGRAEHLLLARLLDRFRRLGLLKAHGRQRTDSTHVLAAVWALHRLERGRETWRHALDVLATIAPAWLRGHAQPAWVERYPGRSDVFRRPKGKEAQRALADTIGGDGQGLLTAIYASLAPSWLREVPAVETLRRVWVQNYLPSETGLHWRTAADGIPPAAHFISSPSDGDAHLATKGTTSWVGYKVILTETCEADAPNLSTHVETTAAPTADGEVTPRIHRALHARDLLPQIPGVDTGFLDAELLVASQREYGVQLLGPTHKDQRGQARAAEGFGSEHFVVDWARRQAICPAGHASSEWKPRVDNRGNASLYIRFAASACGPCPSRPRCTRSTAKYPRRSLAIRPQPQYEALRQRREQETHHDYAKEYAHRAGIEGTISPGVRRCRLWRSRYIGLAKTHLGPVLTAAAINYVRVGERLAGTPRATTHCSPFGVLMTRPAPT